MKTFGDIRFKLAQQGELDALCGVYTAANFLFRRLNLPEDSEERGAHFKRLMTHLAARGKFTISRVCDDGFKNGQVQAAFNKFAKEIGLEVQGRSLGSVMKKRKVADIYSLLESLDDDEAAMIRVDSESHWVLVHSGRNDLLVLDDPFPPAKSAKVSKSMKRIKTADLENGIVFLNA